jgi:hypothetical protein
MTLLAGAGVLEAAPGGRRGRGGGGGAAAAGADARAAPAAHGRGLTLVHFSAQLEPCLSHDNTLHTLNTPLIRATQPLREPPIPYKALKLSHKVDECAPLLTGGPVTTPERADGYWAGAYTRPLLSST